VVTETDDGMAVIGDPAQDRASVSAQRDPDLPILVTRENG
jgi:hypothetical protein